MDGTRQGDLGDKRPAHPEENPMAEMAVYNAASDLIDRNIKLGDLQELIDDSAHGVDVIMQFFQHRDQTCLMHIVLGVRKRLDIAVIL